MPRFLAAVLNIALLAGAAAFAQAPQEEAPPCYITQIEERPGNPPRIFHTSFSGAIESFQQCNSPVTTPFTLLKTHQKAALERRLYLNRFAQDGRILPTIPAQFEGAPEEGLLSFIMPSSLNEQPAFILVEGEKSPDTMMNARYDADKAWVEITDGAAPVLRYYHGQAPLPEGVDPAYARGDYIGALYGPHGENLLDDFPPDHPHHRGINWAWATIQWKKDQHDLFWGKGIWARPIKAPRFLSGPVYAFMEAESEWRWEDTTPLVHEKVVLLAWAAEKGNRFLDIQITLTSLVDDLAFCGRLEHGYSGVNIRMAPGGDQQIRFGEQEEAAAPGAWADYTAKFTGQQPPAGLTLLQHPKNPGYPNPWRKYPDLNFFQPLWPGAQLQPFEKDATITLRYRLWIHEAAPETSTLNTLAATYSEPLTATTSQEGK